jgi:putative transposase
MKFEFIELHRSEFRVAKMCQSLEVSRSAYYAWRNRPISARELNNKKIFEKIKKIYQQSRGLYGSPRITAELKAQGIYCNHKRVARLMQRGNIRAKTRKRFRVIPQRKHQYPVAVNILQQTFQASVIDSIWASDITYIQTKEGWLYLVAILDVCSRMIVGWSMDSYVDHILVLRAIHQALGHRNPVDGCIFHSDRGTQFACDNVRLYLKEQNFTQSMCGKGNCFDNAIMETFFGTLKTELVYFNTYQTRAEAKQSIFEYIEIYYNRYRRHSALDYMSPFEFEYKMKVTVPCVHFIG